MESEKPGFSEDDDHRNPEKIEETVEPSCKRSYECVFCKRGFTNAQALGGHMNIHRRDRLKSSSSSSSSSKQVLNPSVSNPNPNPNPSPAAVTRVAAGQFLFEKSDHDAPDSWDQALRSKLSPNLHTTSYPVTVGSSNFGRFGEKLGSDLTLQIGSSSPKNNNEEIAANSDEEMEDIDLELRLGRRDR